MKYRTSGVRSIVAHKMGKKKNKIKKAKRQSPQKAEAVFTKDQEKDGRIRGLIGHRGLAAIFLFLFSFGVFAPSLRNDFVWDDIKVIQNSSHSLKASRVSSMLIPRVEKSKKQRYYRPVVFASMVLDRAVWGISPFGFHLSNTLFHSVSTVLFYLMALLVLGEFRVGRREEMALLSSLLFALHPMHVESVSWVSGRTDVLCGLFFFPAFIFYVLSYRKPWFLLLSAVFFFFSLLSKEVAIAFPAAVLGFDIASGRVRSRGNVLKYTICGILVLVYLYLRGRAFVIIPEVSYVRVGQSIGEGYQIWGVLKVLLNSYIFYIKELVFPFNFNAFISTVPEGFYHLFSSILVMLLLSILGLLSLRNREGVIAFGVSWVFATLAPSSIIAISWIATTPLAERYLYVPSAGYCVLIGYLIVRAGETVKPQKAVWIAASILCLSYLFFTIDRQSVWRNNVTLWEDTSKRSPNAFITHINYGEALKEAGRRDEAIREFLTVFENPKILTSDRMKALAANSIGIVYLDKGDRDRAEEWFHRALSYYPEYGDACYQIGFIHFIKGDPKNAEEWFHKALSYNPGNEKAYYHLGAIYFIRGEKEGSQSHYRTAERYLKKAIRLSPSYEKAHFVLANVYLRLDEREKAKEQAREALRNGLKEPLAKEAEDILKRL